MPEKLFQCNDLEIWKRGSRYFARYDAGSHQVVMREDEISEQEATFAARENEQAAEMLLPFRKGCWLREWIRTNQMWSRRSDLHQNDPRRATPCKPLQHLTESHTVAARS
jgi:hypothetical protein